LRIEQSGEVVRLDPARSGLDDDVDAGDQPRQRRSGRLRIVDREVAGDPLLDPERFRERLGKLVKHQPVEAGVASI
jgi:hypothetical protein